MLTRTRTAAVLIAAPLLAAPLLAAPLLAPLAVANPALAQDRPLTLPSRDVDVTYAVSRPDVPAQPTLSQRIRWAAAARKLRVDTPSPGLYVVMDYNAHLLSAVRPAQRLVLQLRSEGAGLSTAGLGATGGGFVRGGDASVVGLSCTEWRTRDAAGQAADVCLTADGVLLRARIGRAALIEATRVAYGPVPDDLFAVPADYRRVAPPDSPVSKPPVSKPPAPKPP